MLASSSMAPTLAGCAPTLAPPPPSSTEARRTASAGCAGDGATSGGIQNQPSSFNFARRIRNEPLGSPAAPVPGSIGDRSSGNSCVYRGWMRLEISRYARSVVIRVLPSRHSMRWTGGVGSGTASEMPCLKKKSCSARSLSPTTVSPFGPAPGRVMPIAHFTGLLERSASRGVVEDVDASVLLDLLVVEALRLRGHGGPQDHGHERHEHRPPPPTHRRCHSVLSFSLVGVPAPVRPDRQHVSTGVNMSPLERRDVHATRRCRQIGRRTAASDAACSAFLEAGRT